MGRQKRTFRSFFVGGVYKYYIINGKFIAIGIQTGGTTDPIIFIGT